MPLVLAKYHHSHLSLSLSDSLVIFYCYEMPKDFFAFIYSHTLKIVMNPITPPTPETSQRLDI